MPFKKYTNAVLSALEFNPKFHEVIARKQEILDGVYRVENLTPQSMLFIGFNPAILSCQAPKIAVTEISDQALDYIANSGIKVKHIDSSQLDQYKKSFQCVVEIGRAHV